MRRDANVALGATLMALGLAAGVAALSIGGWGAGEWGARTIPLIAAATIAVAGGAVAASASPRFPRRRTADTQPIAPAALLLGLAVLYVLAIDRVGYLIATALASPAAFAAFGVRRPMRLLVAALLTPLALHVVFFRLLGVFPPMGTWIDLLDWVPL